MTARIAEVTVRLAVILVAVAGYLAGLGAIGASLLTIATAGSGNDYLGDYLTWLRGLVAGLLP